MRNLLAQGTIDLRDPLSPYRNLQNLKPSNIVSSSINLLFGVAGVLAFIYLLMGGIQWITASGDKDAVEKAKKKITHALIGLTIVFSAYALLYIIRVLFNIDTIGVNISPI